MTTISKANVEGPVYQALKDWRKSFSEDVSLTPLKHGYNPDEPEAVIYQREVEITRQTKLEGTDAKEKKTLKVLQTVFTFQAEHPLFFGSRESWLFKATDDGKYGVAIKHKRPTNQELIARLQAEDKKGVDCVSELYDIGIQTDCVGNLAVGKLKEVSGKKATTKDKSEEELPMFTTARSRNR